MGEQQDLPVVAHPEVFIHVEPAVRWRDGERRPIGRTAGPVGEYFAGRGPDGVDATSQFIVAEYG